MSAALQADELRNIVEVLREDKLLAARNNRDGTYTQREQLLTSANVVGDVDGDEVDAFSRKKLFRSEAATSPRLGEKDEFLCGVGHVNRLVECERRLRSTAQKRQARRAVSPLNRAAIHFVSGHGAGQVGTSVWPNRD